MVELTLKQFEMSRALPMLAPAMARGDTTAGAAGLAELLAGASAYTLNDAAGNPAVVYALKVADHEKCRVLWVMAAAGGLPGHDLTITGLQAVEAQARSIHAGQVAITTKRRGLIKKLTRCGYEVTGVTLRKKIHDPII